VPRSHSSARGALFNRYATERVLRADKRAFVVGDRFTSAGQSAKSNPLKPRRPASPKNWHERMTFSNWTTWRDRSDISGLTFPGIYILAISEQPLAKTPFQWLREICYVGMTCSLAGLSGRLRQFDDTIAGRRTSHGGADRMRFAHKHYVDLTSRLFVAASPTNCDSSRVCPETYRAFGQVVKQEFDCIAKYLEHFGSLPKFNDKPKAVKYSHWIRTNAS
jgi:hypothetical protein